MTALLTMVATPLWAYLALFGFLTVDAMIPVVPTQAIMITSGALTVYGDLSLPMVIAIGAAGMFAGDTIAFLLGRSTGHVGRGRLAALRARYAPGHDDAPREQSKTRKAAVRFTRGLRRPGPLVLLLCRFVPGGRMAAGFQAGRTGYPARLFVLYDAAAAICWAGYGGLVGHVGGTAVTQSAWRLFLIAATAALVFGTAGWLLALFGGRKEAESGPALAGPGFSAPPVGPGAGNGRAAGARLAFALGGAEVAAEAEVIAARAASADGRLPRSTPTATGR
ncbi:VTT domain-containing protein [Actinoplanes subtropicus]|uniref:VTT domain-containing protein n=1 Tax=Actinoplanes subtropicus TaxID=543632 RepID=UPI0004C3E493